MPNVKHRSPIVSVEFVPAEVASFNPSHLVRQAVNYANNVAFQFLSLLFANIESVCPQGKPVQQGSSATIACQREVVRKNTFEEMSPIMAPMALPPFGVSGPTWNDTCPLGSFCHVYNPSDLSDITYGHCCPIPKLACPVGEPDSSVYCDNKHQKACNLGTHYCRTVNFDKLTSVSICCPRPCSDGHVMKDGQCVQNLNILRT